MTVNRVWPRCGCLGLLGQASRNLAASRSKKLRIDCLIGLQTHRGACHLMKVVTRTPGFRKYMNYIASRRQLLGATIRAMLFFGSALAGVFFFAAKLALAVGKGAWFDVLQKPDFYPGPTVYCLSWFATSLLAGCGAALIFSSRGAPRRRQALALLAFASCASLVLIAILHTSDGYLGPIVAATAAAVAMCLSAGIASTVRLAAGILLIPSLVWLCAHCLILWNAQQAPPPARSPQAEQLRLAI